MGITSDFPPVQVTNVHPEVHRMIVVTVLVSISQTLFHFESYKLLTLPLKIL